MISSLASDIEDPKARLVAIAVEAKRSKELIDPFRTMMPLCSDSSILGAPIYAQVLAILSFCRRRQTSSSPTSLVRA